MFRTPPYTRPASSLRIHASHAVQSNSQLLTPPSSRNRVVSAPRTFVVSLLTNRALKRQQRSPRSLSDKGQMTHTPGTPGSVPDLRGAKSSSLTPVPRRVDWVDRQDVANCSTRFPQSTQLSAGEDEDSPVTCSSNGGTEVSMISRLIAAGKLGSILKIVIGRQARAVAMNQWKSVVIAAELEDLRESVAVAQEHRFDAEAELARVNHVALALEERMRTKEVAWHEEMSQICGLSEQQRHALLGHEIAARRRNKLMAKSVGIWKSAFMRRQSSFLKAQVQRLQSIAATRNQDAENANRISLARAETQLMRATNLIHGLERELHDIKNAVWSIWRNEIELSDKKLRRLVRGLRRLVDAATELESDRRDKEPLLSVEGDEFFKRLLRHYRLSQAHALRNRQKNVIDDNEPTPTQPIFRDHQHLMCVNA